MVVVGSEAEAMAPDCSAAMLRWVEQMRLYEKGGVLREKVWRTRD